MDKLWTTAPSTARNSCSSPSTMIHGAGGHHMYHDIGDGSGHIMPDGHNAPCQLDPLSLMA